MSITRRLVLKGALFTAATTSAVLGHSLALPSTAMIVYDSRQPQSGGWRDRHVQRAVDVAHEHENFWRTLRGATPRGPVVGLTAWSDLVLARGLLEEKGLRLRVEARCGKLFYWEMS